MNGVFGFFLLYLACHVVLVPVSQLGTLVIWEKERREIIGPDRVPANCLGWKAAIGCGNV